jgi:DNA-directed RNA polymerase subunit RPC12/RpoP
MVYYCIICGAPVNIREDGVKVNGKVVCSKCLGGEPVTKVERTEVKSIWDVFK